MPIESLEAAVLDVLALGDEVKVLAPDAPRMAVAAAAQRIADRHRSASAQPPPIGSSDTSARVARPFTTARRE